MASYRVEIRRCQHIKTSGAQCGSPALKEKEFCYYHQQNRAVAAAIYREGERGANGEIVIPPFEDGHAIQTVLRHVVQLVLERRIERKDAGLMLYALQIASSNLRQMAAEKPRPTQVVVEPEKAGETPLGMTQWSAWGEGRDVEEDIMGDSLAAKGGEDGGAKERIGRYIRTTTAEIVDLHDWLMENPGAGYEQLRGLIGGCAIKCLEESGLPPEIVRQVAEAGGNTGECRGAVCGA